VVAVSGHGLGVAGAVRLKVRKLKAGWRTLKKADCRLGAVRGRRSRRARVREQSPGPGRVLPPGSRVSLEVGS
jgi:hypothetical protein